MAGIITYQLLLIFLIRLRPDLDPSWHTISEWAIGPHGWMMSGAFIISGLSYAALFVLLRSHLPSMLGRIGLGVLLICVVGAVGVGIFTTDPALLRYPLCIRGTLHIIFGTSQLILLPFVALFINLSLGNNRGWVMARRVLLSTAGLPLFGFSDFRGVHRPLCGSSGCRRLWPRREYWVAPAIRLLNIHAVGRHIS
jgi:hypothetical membrane protein